MSIQKIKTADFCRKVSRYSLLTIGILIFIFALLSGAESQGGGIMGIIKNSPNALPWGILLVMLYIAWKRELIGGIIITLLGFFLLYFFIISTGRFHWFPFVLTFLIILFGSFFIISWYLRRNYPKEQIH